MINKTLIHTGNVHTYAHTHIQTRGRERGMGGREQTNDKTVCKSGKRELTVLHALFISLTFLCIFEIISNKGLKKASKLQLRL